MKSLSKEFIRRKDRRNRVKVAEEKRKKMIEQGDLIVETERDSKVPYRNFQPVYAGRSRR